MLIALLGVLLVALGAAIGAFVATEWAGPSYPYAQYQPLGEGRGGAESPWLSGAALGALVALGVWLIQWLLAVSAGDRILLSTAGAKQIQKADAPQLWNVVEEMVIAAGLPKMPRVYVIDDDRPNAFAVGRRPDHAAVAVTSGLLRRLNRDELQGVIAHELGHVRNLDIRFMTIAGVMLGSIVILSEIFLRALWYGGGRRRSSGRRGGGGQAALLIIVIVLAILAPLFAQLLYFACSRRREYLADASAARFTRYPPGLADALEKISRYDGRSSGHEDGGGRANRVLAPMYIVNPVQVSLTSAFATHPPTEERIRILRGMGGAGFAAYEEAYRRAHGAGARVLGQQTLAQADEVAVREPTPEPEEREETVRRVREAADLVAGLANFLFIACPCGVRIKVPPEFRQERIECPRCGRRHEVPVAALAAMGATGDALGEGAAGAAAEGQGASAAGGGRSVAEVAARPVRAARGGSGTGGLAAAPAQLRYKRRGTGWETFRCACGHPVQISPAFDAALATCRKCGRKIAIEGA